MVRGAELNSQSDSSIMDEAFGLWRSHQRCCRLFAALGETERWMQEPKPRRFRRVVHSAGCRLIFLLIHPPSCFALGYIFSSYKAQSWTLKNSEEKKAFSVSSSDFTTVLNFQQIKQIAVCELTEIYRQTFWFLHQNLASLLTFE